MVKSFCKKAELSCEEQLAALKEEMEDMRRRYDDYIHEARLVVENSVNTFKAQLAEKIRPQLVEVIYEPEDQQGLTEDQEFFRRRLREIRETLQELGVSI